VRAAAYITDTLKSCGYATASQGYEVHGRHVENIEAVLTGSSESSRIVT
jgi:hypothetical protein